MRKFKFPKSSYNTQYKACPRHWLRRLMWCQNWNFTQNLIVFLLSSLMLPIIAAWSIYDGIFHQKFDFFLNVCCCAATSHHMVWAYWAEYGNKLKKNVFSDCKNSFYVKILMLSKQWMTTLMNTKSIPQDSAWNFDSDITWVGLINPYDKASNMYHVHH